MTDETIVPRWIGRWYWIAAAYGVLALGAAALGPVPAKGAEIHYGFIGTAMAFQFVFFVISSDPLRYRALMPCAVLEKAAFAIPVFALWAAARLEGPVVAAGAVDAVLGVGFLVAWLRLRRA